MSRSRLALVALIVLVVVFLGGLFLGRSGRGELEQARTQAELQNELNRARVSMLHARLEIVNSNFGQASQHLNAAREPLQSLQDRLNAMGRNADAGHVATALSAAAEAQTLALALNRDADSRIATALDALNGVQ